MSDRTSPRRWPRRLAIALAVVLLARLALDLALAPGLRAAASAAGLELTLDDVDLDLLDGAFELRGAELRLEGADDRAPLASIEHLSIDADVSRLLTGALHVHRIELDGLRAELVRGPDGAWLLPGAGAEPSDPDGAKPDAGAEAEPAEPRTLDPTRAPFPLFPPVTVGALLGQGVVLRVRDERPGHELERELRLDLRASDLGHAERTARVSAHGHGPAWLDVLRFDLEVEPDGAGGLVGAGEALLAGLELGALGSLPAELGIEPAAEQLDARAQLALAVAPTGDDPGGPLALELSVERASLRADLQPAFELERLAVEVPSWSQASIERPRLSLSNLRGRAARDGEGRLVVAGLTLVGTPAATEPQTPPAQPEPGPQPALVDAAVSLEALRFEWTDASLPGAPAQIALELDRLELAQLDLPLTADTRPISIDARVGDGDGAGGQAVELLGELRPRPDGFDATVGVEARALSLAALEPYLSAAGLRADLDSGSGAATVTLDVDWRDAATRVDLRLAGARVDDGERTLFQWDRAALPAIELPLDGPPRLGRLEIEGLALPFARLESGAWTVAGIATAGEAPAEALTSALSLDSLTVDERWNGERRSLTVAARASVEGLVQQLAADGSIALDGDALSVAFDFDGSGVETRLAAPLLAEAGLTAEFEGATLTGGLTLDRDAQGRIDLTLAELAYARGEQVLLGLGAADLRGLDTGGASPRFDALTLRSPTAAVHRDGDGVWHALGLRFAPPTAVGAAEQPPASTPEDGTVAATAPPIPADGEPTPLDALPIPTLSIGAVLVSDGRIELRDELAAAANERTVDFAAELAPFETGPEASDFALRLSAAASDLAEGLELTVDGRLDPRDTNVQVAARAGAIDAAGLRDFLPPTVAPATDSFALDSALALRLTSADDGGLTVDANFERLELTDGAGAPLAAVGAARLRASRIDAARGAFLIDEVSTEGLVLDVAADDGGGLTIAGMRLTPASGPPADSAPTPSTEAADPTGTALSERPTPPTVRVEVLDLDFGRVTLRGGPLGAEGEPLVLGGGLRGVGALELCSAAPEELAPLTLEARLNADSAALAVDVALEPFADRPRLSADIAISGVRGDRIRAVAPGLMDRIDPDLLGEGQLSATVQAELDLRRRHPLAFDLRDGFGGLLEVVDIEWRDAVDDERFLGLAALRAELKAFRPGTGLVHLSSVEIQEPFLRARRTPEGLDILGLRLITADEGPIDGGDESSAEATEAAAAGDGTAEDSTAEDSNAEDRTAQDSNVQDRTAEGGAAADSPAAASGEFRLDQLLITGLDLEIVDESTEPATTIPLDQLDVEVRNFTTRAFEEPLPIRFSAYLGSGDVELPVPVKTKGGLIGGIASGLASAIVGGDEEVTLEARPLFQELGLSGQLALAPEPSGWVRTHAVGFELLGLRGLARGSGVELGAGTVDLGAQLRFPGDGSVKVDSTTIFTDLSVSEPPGGPISKWLKLPAPLDSVVFLLVDEGGELRLPVALTVGAGGVGAGTIAATVATALGSVIADAVASSPLRAASMLGGLVGLGGGEEEAAEPTVVELAFPVGAAILEPDALAAVAAAAESLRADDALEVVVEHTVGRLDVERTEALVNPDPSACIELAERVTSQLSALRAERTEQAATARAALLAGSADDATAAAEALRATERQIGLAEAALDDLLSRLRPGDERRGPRRARAGALELAELRQTAVVEALLAIDPELTERIDPRRARLDLEAAGDTGQTLLTLRARR